MGGIKSPIVTLPAQCLGQSWQICTLGLEVHVVLYLERYGTLQPQPPHHCAHNLVTQTATTTNPLEFTHLRLTVWHVVQSPSAFCISIPLIIMASRRCLYHYTRPLATSPPFMLRPLQHTAGITTSSESPGTEPKPTTVDQGTSGKRIRPLTAEQEHFLDSAVCHSRHLLHNLSKIVLSFVLIRLANSLLFLSILPKHLPS